MNTIAELKKTSCCPDEISYNDLSVLSHLTEAHLNEKMEKNMFDEDQITKEYQSCKWFTYIYKMSGY